MREEREKDGGMGEDRTGWRDGANRVGWGKTGRDGGKGEEGEKKSECQKKE